MSSPDCHEARTCISHSKYFREGVPMQISSFAGRKRHGKRQVGCWRMSSIIRAYAFPSSQASKAGSKASSLLHRIGEVMFSGNANAASSSLGTRASER
jgi:hypothetical protein